MLSHPAATLSLFASCRQVFAKWGGSPGRNEGVLRCKMPNLFRLGYHFPYQIPRFGVVREKTEVLKESRTSSCSLFQSPPNLFVLVGMILLSFTLSSRVDTLLSVQCQPTLSHFLSSGDRQDLEQGQFSLGSFSLIIISLYFLRSCCSSYRATTAVSTSDCLCLH